VDVQCVVDAGGRIRAGLPLALVSSRLTGRRLVCVPFADHAAPLTTAGDNDAGAVLGRALRAATDAARVPVYVHGRLPPGPGVNVFARYHHHTLPLHEDVDRVVRGFRRRSSLLRGARRAEREGLRYERRTDPDALRAFYRLNQLTRRRLGVPVQPRRFIMGLSALMQRGLGFVGVVRDGERAVAAGVFLTLGRTLFYKYGASDPRALGKRPNNLLFVEVIRAACQEGMKWLDFGRTDLGHESLRTFKLSFGAEERELEYHAIGPRTIADRRTDRHADRLAPVLRHSPLLLNRAIGELLYRHVG
jgi:CelD/BcsL family acetyltransferase involved in cellulose biosynthesis